MLLAHPYVINTRWQEQLPPHECGKHVPDHAATNRLSVNEEHVDIWDEGGRFSGPCLFKLWELIPVEAAQTAMTLDSEEDDGRLLCLREIGSTVYQYRPTSESAEGLRPGLFAALPITGFALIRFADGSVNEKAKQNILTGLQAHQERALPFYESDR